MVRQLSLQQGMSPRKKQQPRRVSHSLGYFELLQGRQLMRDLPGSPLPLVSPKSSSRLLRCSNNIVRRMGQNVQSNLLEAVEDSLGSLHPMSAQVVVVLELVAEALAADAVVVVAADRHIAPPDHTTAVAAASKSKQGRPRLLPGQTLKPQLLNPRAGRLQ